MGPCPGPHRWLSVSDCARSIGVSPWWVRQRIDEGVLDALAIRAGRRKLYRICSRDWAALVARCTGPAIDPRFDV